MAKFYLRSLKGEFRKIIINDDKEWDQKIEIALMTIINIVNESTKMSQLELIYEILPRTPNNL